MTYLLQTNRKKRGNVIFIKATLCALCAITLVFLLKKPLVLLGVQASRPVAAVKESGIALWFSSKESLINQVTSLQAENQKLLLTREIGAEAELLSGTSTKKYSTGQVVVSMGSTPFDTIKVKTLETVEVGKRVKAGDVYIGEISEVVSSIAFVRMYSTPGKTLKGFFGSKQIPVEAEGLGGGVFRILIPKGMEARVGDTFLLGEEKHLIAVSQRVFESPEETFIFVEAALPVNPFEISEVLIEK